MKTKSMRTWKERCSSPSKTKGRDVTYIVFKIVICNDMLCTRIPVLLSRVVGFVFPSPEVRALGWMLEESQWNVEY